MDVLSLETLAEHNFFLSLCLKNAGLFDQWTHVGAINLEHPVINVDETNTGGVTPSATPSEANKKWYWVNSGNRVKYEMLWGFAQPDNGKPRPNQYCLSVGKYIDKLGNVFMFGFNDLDCFGTYEFKFICQK